MPGLRWPLLKKGQEKYPSVCKYILGWERLSFALNAVLILILFSRSGLGMGWHIRQKGLTTDFLYALVSLAPTPVSQSVRQSHNWTI